MRILVCGGGIAGLAVTYWLARGGHDVVVAERHPVLRATCLAPGGRMIMRRSHNPDETQVYFALRERSAQASAIHRAGVKEQKRFRAGRFRDAGWQTRRFVDGMAEADFFYSQEVVQVRAGRWSQGRVVLLGTRRTARPRTAEWELRGPWPEPTSWPA
jgi:glycine/D-amino acid oxidase-like deaminating enzyme